ncbi:hypothetical protein U1Q18_009295 [Sarracenia purpurea var. burkii]
MRDSEQFREENKCNLQKGFPISTFFHQQQSRHSRVEEGKYGERTLPGGEKASFPEITMEEANKQVSIKGDSVENQIAETPEVECNGGGITGLSLEGSSNTEGLPKPLPSIVNGREGKSEAKAPVKGTLSGGLSEEGNTTEFNFLEAASHMQVEEEREKVKDWRFISGRKGRIPGANLSSPARCYVELEENSNASLRKRKFWARKIRSNSEAVPDLSSVSRHAKNALSVSKRRLDKPNDAIENLNSKRAKTQNPLQSNDELVFHESLNPYSQTAEAAAQPCRSP